LIGRVAVLLLLFGAAGAQEDDGSWYHPRSRMRGRRSGGSGLTENTVELGLRWLAQNQREDGSWDGQEKHDVGVTGLAALAFLGAGYTGVPVQYAGNIRHALAYLMKSQGDAGRFGPIGQKGIYNHAIATHALCDAYGRPEVVERVREVAGVQGVDTLEAVVGHLRAVHPDAADVLDVDLGEVRGFDYYTGARLRVWSPAVSVPVLRGGRYDDLVGRFGAQAPATGFAIDLDALEQALGDRGPAPGGRSGRLVALHPECDGTARTEASRRAAAARGAGEPAWVQEGLTLAQAQVVAADAGAGALTYLQPGESGDMAVLRFRLEQTSGPQWIAE